VEVAGVLVGKVSGKGKVQVQLSGFLFCNGALDLISKY